MGRVRARTLATPPTGALPSLLAIASGSAGGAVTTTLDAAVQRQAAAAAREHLARLAPAGVSAAAVVVLDTPSAECLAAVSLSRGADARGVDLTRRVRSTGSVLKPLVYAAAFEAGVCGPASVLDDAPAAWPGYEPRDFDRTFRGQLTAAEALADSRNVPAMLVLARAGVGHVAGVMHAAGLEALARSARPYGLSLAAGGAGATVLEVAEAYAGLARGGVGADVTFTRSLWGDSDTCSVGLETRPPSPGVPGSGVVPAREAQLPLSPAYPGEGEETAIPPEPDPGAPRAAELQQAGRRFLTERACWQVLAALASPERTAGVSRAAARLGVAWKTGTSSGLRDAWCAAVTPRRTVVVWLGNPGGAPSAALVGRDAAAPLALELIAALDDVPAGWPAVDANTPAEESTRAAAAVRTPLTIISPAPGREIVLGGDLPADRQRVPLKAAGGGDRRRGGDGSGGELHWFVDGVHLGAAPVGRPVWWSPAPGAHEVRVVDPRGGSAHVSVVVRRD
jgi:penicillin-binding protein 1C